MSRYLPFAVAIGLIAFTTIAMADPRPFTFVYDAYPHGKDGFEIEQWVTYKNHSNEDPGFDRLEFRHEIEFGVTDKFDLGIYVSDWSYEDSAERKNARWHDVAFEGIYYLSNPVMDPVGIGLYGEVVIGDDVLEFENKLILHKDIGKWTLAYNLIVETEIEGIFSGDENEVEGVLGHAFGISYALGGPWRVGAELTAESEFEEWRYYAKTPVYCGPNLSYQSNRWWATITPTFQVSDLDDEPDFVIRAIVGIEF
jgi:hypothetical protein